MIIRNELFILLAVFLVGCGDSTNAVDDSDKKPAKQATIKNTKKPVTAKKGALSYKVILVLQGNSATASIILKNETDTKLVNFDYRISLDKNRIKISDEFNNEYRILRVWELNPTFSVHPGKTSVRHITFQPVIEKAKKLSLTIPTGVKGESTVTLHVPLSRTKDKSGATTLYQDAELAKLKELSKPPKDITGVKTMGVIMFLDW